MKTFFKSSATIILILFFITAILIAVTLLLSASVFYTYKIFTAQDPIASLQISEQKYDDLGPYADVTLIQKFGISPMAKIFNQSDSTTLENQIITTKFKLYGDIVYLGGPIIKFEDYLTFLNFNTIYKIALINSAYEFNIDLEKNKTKEMFSTYELNGGLEGWREMAKKIQDKNSIEGHIYRYLIDSVPQVDKQGIIVLDKPQSATLCITEEGFFFCDKPLVE